MHRLIVKTLRIRILHLDPARSVVNADCRCWDIPNLWICDGSVFPTVGGVNPSLTIQAIACRTADRIRAMARRGELATL